MSHIPLPDTAEDRSSVSISGLYRGEKATYHLLGETKPFGGIYFCTVKTALLALGEYQIIIVEGRKGRKRRERDGEEGRKNGKKEGGEKKNLHSRP